MPVKHALNATGSPKVAATDWNAAHAADNGEFAQPGDFKFAMRKTIPAGWIQANSGTIGSAASGATNRANADTADLFTLWWTDFTDAEVPIFTSAGGASTRGASAAADFAANKRMTVPPMADRYPRSASTVAVSTQQAQEMPAHYHRTAFGWDASTYYAWLDGSNLPAYGSDVEGSATRFAFATGSSGAGARLARTDTVANGQSGENRPPTMNLLGLYKL